MKQIKIPFLSALNSSDLTLAAEILEISGEKGIIESVNWPETYPYKPITLFFVARSDRSIFIKYFVRGNVLKASYSIDQSPVHEDSCVEFFCKLPDSELYTNFEFNCIGTCSAGKRKARKENVTHFSQNELLEIKRFPSIGKRAFNEMQGIFEWELTVEIPFKLIGIDTKNLPIKLLGNFYKCADDTESKHYVSWSPVETEKPDFHRPEFFGELIL